ncbi:putative membrane protein [Clostridium sp. CAG:710]|nr:putative membrane protein [Clostridium sp. CAG:710]
MNALKKNINILFKGIYAGMMIGIGGTVYLSVSNSIIGAIFFSVGLLTICIYKMNLYTGMIGYIIENKLNYIVTLLLTLIGNFIGTMITSLLVLNTRIANLSVRAKEISSIKINDNYLSIFILSIFCGMLMYIAVNTFKKGKDSIVRYLAIFICVIVFILSGFEHCIANMYYISLAKLWSLKAVLSMLIMILGNSVGSIFIAIFNNKIKEN